ncbi:hypothetical protein R6Q59_013603 [Mikania micrantha]
MKVERLYLKLIKEWVGSLTIDWGNQSPSTLRLIGTIEGLQVVMSRENPSHVARFDTKPSNQYVYPSVDDLQAKPALHPTWYTMLQTIFQPGKETTMRRNNLKIEAKLLLVIIHTNVVPHRGDKTMVRHPEVPVLYALMAGKSKISFRYLAMLNIWEDRNNKEKIMIPHFYVYAYKGREKPSGVAN